MPIHPAAMHHPVVHQRLMACIMLSWLIIAMLMPAQARESDLQQAIDIKADSSTFDERAGVQTLSGNVEITQGTMAIKADKISVTLKNSVLNKIEGQGSPIIFQQENEAGELMQGQAQSIIYDADKGTLTLKGKATLSMPKQNLVSEEITVDSRSQTFKAQGGGDTGRVSIQIQPPTPRQ